MVKFQILDSQSLSVCDLPKATQPKCGFFSFNSPHSHTNLNIKLFHHLKSLIFWPYYSFLMHVSSKFNHGELVSWPYYDKAYNLCCSSFTKPISWQQIWLWDKTGPLQLISLFSIYMLYTCRFLWQNHLFYRLSKPPNSVFEFFIFIPFLDDK